MIGSPAAAAARARSDRSRRRPNSLFCPAEDGVARDGPCDVDTAEPGLLHPAQMFRDGGRLVDGVVVRIAEVVPSQLSQPVGHAEIAALLQRPLGDRTLIRF